MPSRLATSLRASPFLAGSAAVQAAGAAAVLLAPQTGIYVLSALVANHLVIGTAGLFPRCGWLGPNMTHLPAAAAGTRRVALTFDDGPDPLVTPRVLDLLDQAGQLATFFCIGRRAEAQPDLVAEIRRRGHGIENHSYSHPNGFALQGPRSMAREIARAQEAIERSGGGRPQFFRAPAGIQNPWLASVLIDADLSLVSWTRRGFDTVSRSAPRIAARLIGRGLRDGDVLLLHDRMPIVLEALPRVLDDMERRGLRSVALPHSRPNEGSKRA
jgi:peptidoglycan/xylan/chitin deacetylase (PgdA/CDA1 family)